VSDDPTDFSTFWLADNRSQRQASQREPARKARSAMKGTTFPGFGRVEDSTMKEVYERGSGLHTEGARSQWGTSSGVNDPQRTALVRAPTSYRIRPSEQTITRHCIDTFSEPARRSLHESRQEEPCGSGSETGGATRREASRVLCRFLRGRGAGTSSVIRAWQVKVDEPQSVPSARITACYDSRFAARARCPAPE